MNALELNGVSKHFKNFSLQSISFTLPKGYIMGYVGQNGAGKTTSINLITGLYKPDEGTIRTGGMSMQENPVEIKRIIGYIGDESYYYPEFRVGDVRAVMKGFYPDFDTGKFERYVKKWKLPLNTKIGDFSRGMKVKLMFAGVMSRETEILLLDEATSGLDPFTREEILEMMQRYIEDGEHSVLFSTHIMEDLEKIADYIFFIEGGKKVFCETREDLMDSYVMVKGGRESADEVRRKGLIGFTDSEVGFHGILPVEQAVGLSKEILIERASVNDIVVAYQKDANRKNSEGGF